MHRIPANSKVRRRLFSEDSTADQARGDNFTNILQESMARESKEKSKKWSFDFKNEVPLPGDYEWWQKSENEWIGMKIDCGDLDKYDNGECSVRRHVNESTPVQERDESVPIIRKRRRDIENGGKSAARRRVDFDECSYLRRLAF